jgi:hypothetical protein
MEIQLFPVFLMQEQLQVMVRLYLLELTHNYLLVLLTLVKYLVALLMREQLAVFLTTMGILIEY